MRLGSPDVAVDALERTTSFLRHHLTAGQVAS
jgi:hypothetical protein